MLMIALGVHPFFQSKKQFQNEHIFSTTKNGAVVVAAVGGTYLGGVWAQVPVSTTDPSTLAGTHNAGKRRLANAQGKPGGVEATGFLWYFNWIWEWVMMPWTWICKSLSRGDGPEPEVTRIGMEQEQQVTTDGDTRDFLNPHFKDNSEFWWDPQLDEYFKRDPNYLQIDPYEHLQTTYEDKTVPPGSIYHQYHYDLAGIVMAEQEQDKDKLGGNADGACSIATFNGSVIQMKEISGSD